MAAHEARGQHPEPDVEKARAAKRRDVHEIVQHRARRAHLHPPAAQGKAQRAIGDKLVRLAAVIADQPEIGAQPAARRHEAEAEIAEKDAVILVHGFQQFRLEHAAQIEPVRAPAGGGAAVAKAGAGGVARIIAIGAAIAAAITARTRRDLIAGRGVISGHLLRGQRRADDQDRHRRQSRGAAKIRGDHALSSARSCRGPACAGAIGGQHTPVAAGTHLISVNSP